MNLDIPARSVPELIALLRANPGKYSFGSPGGGTAVHLSGELFEQMARVEMVHVPYRGSAPAQLDLVAGRIAMMFDNIPGTLTLAREKVRPLAVTSRKRSPGRRRSRAVSEFLPGFDVVSWTCLCGPAGLPPATVSHLSELTKRALAAPALIQAYSNLGASPWWTTPEDIIRYRAEQQQRLAPLIRASGATIE